MTEGSHLDRLLDLRAAHLLIHVREELDRGCARELCAAPRWRVLEVNDVRLDGGQRDRVRPHERRDAGVRAAVVLEDAAEVVPRRRVVRRE